MAKEACYRLNNHRTNERTNLLVSCEGSEHNDDGSARLTETVFNIKNVVFVAFKNK